ncbi:MAG: serine/threonine protein phosphatase [Clostridiales bacterium]|nr:serine/threonine protein phosphatase [Clostridiales bacterium]
MKIYAISDLHMSNSTDKPMDVFGGNWVDYMDKIRSDWFSKVTASDVVLIGGDISWAMKIEDAKTDIDTLSDLPGKIIMIKGNHDYWWNGIGKVRDILPPSVYALQNDSIRFENVIICGSRCWSVPGSPDFNEQDLKIYNREVERLKLSLKSAVKERKAGDKLIALVHFPPFNVQRDNSAFTDVFEEYGVDAVVYGHLHGKNVRADKLVVKNGIKYYLTSCDLVDNKLTEIKL